jgi:hypothetical protein
VVVDVFVDAAWVSSSARAASVAVDEHLGSKVDLRPHVAAKDVQAIAEGARGAMSPARSTLYKQFKSKYSHQYCRGVTTAKPVVKMEK